MRKTGLKETENGQLLVLKEIKKNKQKVFDLKTFIPHTWRQTPAVSTESPKTETKFLYFLIPLKSF